jgi:hypothetical protein
MLEIDNDKVFHILDEVIQKAQLSIEKTKYFKPFATILKSSGELEIFENEIEDTIKNYELLEQTVKQYINVEYADIVVLVVDTVIPENFVKDVPQSIRLHLEERSKIDKKIAAKYIYVPYEIYKVKDEKMYVKLHHPIAVGFPAQYIIK